MRSKASPPARAIPVRPVKGQILRLHDPAGPGLLTRVLRMTGGYLVPRGDGRYVLGATMEERGFDTTVTAGAVFELLRDAIELLPWIAELVIDELSAGLRPATPDNLPAIGPGAIAGLHWATGHYPPRRSCWRRSPPSWSSAALAGEDSGSRHDVRADALRRPWRWRHDRAVTVNGERRELPAGATVASVVALLRRARGPRGGGGGRRRGRAARRSGRTPTLPGRRRASRSSWRFREDDR